MAYKITLSNKNKEIAESLLFDVAKSLDILSVKYWLEGGTLLGIKRESRLLPWDNDLDFEEYPDGETNPNPHTGKTGDLQ